MKLNNPFYLASIYLVLASLFWAGNFVVGKAASIIDIPPISLNFYRWFSACLVLLPFTYKELINKRRVIFDNIFLFSILGFLAVTVFNSALFYSLRHTQVITGLLMISTVPVMIILFSSLLKIEKTNLFQITGVFLSLAGVMFIITKADLNNLINLTFNRGDIFALIAMFAWSLYSTLLKKRKSDLSPIATLQVVITCGVFFLIPMYYMDYKLGSVIKFETSFFLVLFYVVLFPGIISFLFWIKGVTLIGANRSGVFLHLMPIFGAMMAMFIFNEKILFYHFLGAIFIIAGITISNKKTQNA